MSGTAHPRCSRVHRGWDRPIPMDRVLTGEGGFACPGILLDGSDCGYEIGVVQAVPADELAELRALVAEILDAVEAVSDRAGMRSCVAVWRKRAGLVAS